MSKDRIILNLNPQTNVRATQNVAKIFRIPESCPKNCGLPRTSQKQPKVLVETMQETHPDLWQALGGDSWKPRKKREYIRYGCPHSLSYENVMYKKRLSRYSDYKKKLRELAADQNLVIPPFGCSIYFYVPMPTAWSNKKRKATHGQPCTTGIDIDNYFKAFSDGLYGQDKFIAQLSGLGKFWLETEIFINEKGQRQASPGYIEILLNQPTYNPFNVKFINYDNLRKKNRSKEAT